MAEPVPIEARVSTPAPAVPTREWKRLERLQASALVVLATAIVLGGLWLAKLPILVLLISTLLAFILAPIVDLLSRCRVPRAVGAAGAVVLFLVVLFGAVHFGYNSAVAFSREMPKYSSEIRRAVTKIQKPANDLQRTTEQVLPGATDTREPIPVKPSESWSTWTTERFGPVAEIVLSVSFIPFLVYFMLTWEGHVRRSTVRLFHPSNRDTAYETLGSIAMMVRSFIVGNVVIGLLVGIASVAVFFYFGLPYFYFTGVLSGFLTLVPYLGLILAVIPPLITSIGHVSGSSLVGVAATVIALHLIAVNVLYPKILGRRMQLNPLAVTIALLFWGWLWGGMGLVLAIPLTAAMKIVFDNVEQLKGVGDWLGE